jgi:hypothetical protein
VKKYVSLSLSVACTIFIYVNSLMDGTTSSAVSEIILEVIHDVAEKALVNEVEISYFYDFIYWVVCGCF